MTETEKKALALIDEARREHDMGPIPDYLCARAALIRAIEQHEAFRQEVSDAVEAVFAGYHDAPIPWVVMRRKLEPFIIPKPDPLVEVLQEISGEGGYDNFDHYAYRLRSALEARDLEIREKQQ